MDSTTLIGFIAFALVAGLTPGPNNLMLTASGANYGFRRSLPHIAGINAGFCSLVVAGGFGLAGLFAAVPMLYDIMKAISIVFLLYLAWKIATATSGGNKAGDAKDSTSRGPLTFIEAAMFQIVNPKSVAVIISSVSAYTTDAESLAGEVLILVLVFFLVTIISTTTWCLFGTAIGRLFVNPVSLRRFNICMASLLLASMAPILFT